MSSADQDLNIQRLIDAHTVKLKVHHREFITSIKLDRNSVYFVA